MYERGEILHGDDGTPLRMSGTAQDITERKQIEEQLNQAQKMEAVGQLTGGVAHDFNNLPTVIMGSLELIRDEGGDHGVSINMIDRGIKAAERGAALTHRLLAFSRKQTLLPTTVDLNILVLDMAYMLRRTLGETIETANVSLSDEFSAAQAGVDPGHYVELKVLDTGSGITVESLAHVFEPFFTTKEGGKGSGLGLSMVYGFAKQSGGNVKIESEPGSGTMVKLYLPRSESTDKDRTIHRGKSDIPMARGENILIVEDDADVRMLTATSLSGLGYKVLEAGSAEAALKKIRLNADIDLLLSDVVLPGTMNGPDLATEVCRRQPTTEIAGQPAGRHFRGRERRCSKTHGEFPMAGFIATLTARGYQQFLKMNLPNPGGRRRRGGWPARGCGRRVFP